MLSLHGARLSNLSVLPCLQPHNGKSKKAGEGARQHSHPEQRAALKQNDFASLPSTACYQNEHTKSRNYFAASVSFAGFTVQRFFVSSVLSSVPSYPSTAVKELKSF